MSATEARAVDIERLAAQLDGAQARLAELDPLPRQIVKDHLTAVDELHREALRTLVRALRADERGKELLFALVEEPVVHMVLAMHGIIRGADPLTVAEAALAAIRPGIALHGGDVQLSHIADGVAYVRLSGACNGCSMASVTMRDGVEQALKEALPSLAAVEVLPNDPEPVAEPASRPPAQHGWFETFPARRIKPGTLEAFSLRPDEGEPVEVIVVNAAGQLAAYVNACAHQGMPLDNALVDGDEGTITCRWHGFCFDSTNGECLTMPGAQLEQLPLRIDGGHVWVRASN